MKDRLRNQFVADCGNVSPATETIFANYNNLIEQGAPPIVIKNLNKDGALFKQAKIFYIFEKLKVDVQILFKNPDRVNVLNDENNGIPNNLSSAQIITFTRCIEQGYSAVTGTQIAQTNWQPTVVFS